MKIALVGYGKMGIAIEELAKEAGHTISFKISKENRKELTQLNPKNTDIVIEFSHPECAVENITKCLEAQLPVVCGTTGWLAHWHKVAEICNTTNGSFFYASNYSIGVNLFFKLNEFAARLMAHQNYSVSLHETHHTEKKDSPSGTAITLAEPILDARGLKTWVNHTSNQADTLEIISKREPGVPGTHTVSYRSAVDEIALTHTAHTRRGFAKGALAVAEWMVAKQPQGMLSMKDFLSF